MQSYLRDGALESQIEAFKDDRLTSGFLVDFDGTLSSIVPKAEQARIVPGGTSVLEQLGSKYGVVAIVSGRRAEDVWGKVHAEGLRYVGLYGAEEWVGGEVRQPEEAEAWRGAAGALAAEASRFIQGHSLQGCEVEHKDMAVSLHFRNATDPGAGELLLDWAGEAASRISFLASMGRKVVDVRPAGISKAAALERLVKEHSLGRALVAGDDSTDVEAMRRAGELLGPGAFRVGVRSNEEPAGLVDESEMLVSSCEELVELLKRFI